MISLSRAASAIGALLLLNACAGHTLHDAVRANDVERFRVALADGEDIEEIYQKDTPLLLASWLGRVEMVVMLLDEGADPNAVSSDKEVSPLQIAAHAGHLEIVDLLASGGALLEAKNIHGHTALHQAAMQGQGAVVERLLDLGSEIEARANGGGTPLHEAAFAGKAEVVELLLRRGADVYATTAPGKTAEDFARERGHLEVAAALESLRTGDRAAFEEAEAVGTSAAFEEYLRRFADGRYEAEAKQKLNERRFRDALPDPEKLVSVELLRAEACLVRYDTLVGAATGRYYTSTMVGADESGTTVANLGPWINLCRSRTIVVKTCWLGPAGKSVRHEAQVAPLDLVSVAAPAAVSMDSRGELQTEVASLVKSLCFADQPCDFPICLPIHELPMLPW